jgi:hypothetical protein
MKMKFFVTTSISAFALIGFATYWSTAQADTATTIQVAIPNNVSIVKDNHQILFIGKPTSVSTVNCAPGSPQPQTIVALDPGGADAAQITGVLAFHDHEIPLGSRYKITSDGTACNADLKLYTATLN